MNRIIRRVCAALVGLGMVLAWTGTASGATARPAATPPYRLISPWLAGRHALPSTGATARPAAKPPYHITGPWVAGRHVLSHTGFKTVATTPIGFMFTSGGTRISMNLGPGTSNSAWQPSLPLSWKGTYWEASGTWKVTTCGNGTLAPAHVKFVLYGTSFSGSSATDFSGLYYVDQPKSECGIKADAKSKEFLYTPFNPPWWSGNCDVGNLPGSYPGPDWHGLISCGPGSDEYSIASGPLAGDEEWQCAELAQRWLYEEFGIPNVAQGLPPSGGGKTVATYYWNYLKSHPALLANEPLTLEKGKGPLGPGDVISYSDSGAGHVGVVTKVTATKYTIIQQNGANGRPSLLTLNYTNHVPQGAYREPVVAWLHITAQFGPTSRFVTLGSNRDRSFNQLLGINNNGVIAGYFGNGGKGHPSKGYTIRPPYAQRDIRAENFPRSAQTQVTGLNDRGVTVGFFSTQNKANTSRDNYFGFYSVRGHFHKVDFPTRNHARPPVNELLGVNNHDVAVGVYLNGAGIARSYTYNIRTRKFTRLRLPGARHGSVVLAINNKGQVAGAYSPNGTTIDGFVKRGGRFIRLAVPGATLTAAYGVNDSDWVVGAYVVSSGALHGFIWKPGHGFTTVDDPNGIGATLLNGINDKNDIVGSYVNSAGKVDGLVIFPGS